LVAAIGFALAAMGRMDRYLRILAAGDPARVPVNGSMVTAGTITGAVITSGAMAGGTPGGGGITTGATIANATLTGVTLTGATVTPNPGGGPAPSPHLWNSKEGTIWWCKCFANASFSSVFLTGLSLALFIGFSVFTPVVVRTESVAIEDASAVAINLATNKQNPNWQVLSLSYNAAKDEYEITLLEQTSGEKFRVNVPRSGGPVTQAVRI
jgi:hypothetical protein